MDSSLEDYKESKKGKLVSCKLKKKDFCMQALKDINFRIDLSVCYGNLVVFVFFLVIGM